MVHLYAASGRGERGGEGARATVSQRERAREREGEGERACARANLNASKVLAHSAEFVQNLHCAVVVGQI